MAKFAFMVPPLTGHINPTLSVGAELLQRGHEVAWIGLDESLHERLPKGGQSLLVQETGVYSDKRESTEYLNRISQKQVTGIESVKFLYEEVLVPLNRFMFTGIAAWLERFQPDVAINDHQLFAAAFAAHSRGISYATSVTAPAAIKMQKDLPGVYEWEQKQMMTLQQELGLPADAGIACSGELALVFTSDVFFGGMDLPRNYCFTGPAIQHRPATIPFDWEYFDQMTEGYPRVLVSIGTTFDHTYKKDFFEKVISSLGNSCVRVVVVCDPQLFETWPDNFMVCEKIPQIELLPYLDAVVCHGGHNTVCESLVCGLPLVVIPIAYDQSYVAGRVVDTGCGLRLNYKRFKAQHLKEAVDEVLTNNSYKQAALKMQKTFEMSGGTGKAVAMLEAMEKNEYVQVSQADKVSFNNNGNV